VRNRRFGEVTRLEVHPSMPAWLREILMSEFAEESESLVPWLTEEDIYEVHGLMHAAELIKLAGLDVPELRDPPSSP
jgi:polyphosphate kinase